MLATYEDPLGRILDLDSRTMGRGLIVGFLAAIVLHVAGAAEAARVGNGVGSWAVDLRTNVHAMLTRMYEIEMVNPPPPPEEKAPEPEPEAPPKPVAATPPPKAAPRDNQPPPAPAQAGKILTQEPDPEAPVDLTGEGFVTGSAETYAGGVTANSGTSKTAVRSLGAAVGGTPGATGTGRGAGGQGSGTDLSRSASLAGSSNWDCAWPPEADAEQIDFQRVQIAVTVRPDGTAQDVKVIGDPGHGFGRAARQCALRQRYNPPLDRQGNAVTGTMPPIFVRFNR